MAVKELGCEAGSLAGPLDPRVVQNLQRRYPLDPVFLAYMDRFHGGTPRIGAFNIGPTRYEIGAFLTLLDRQSQLRPPFRPHFEDERMDERVVNSIGYLTDYEHSTSRALFGGLLPFAATQAQMCLDRAYVDLVCFDYRLKPSKPPVVVWLADRANSAYMEWERLPIEEQFDDNENFRAVPWDDFLLPAAPDFASFTERLYPKDLVAFSVSWRTPTVTDLAQAIYDDRRPLGDLFDNHRLAILADALEEAGCDNADILGHLRSGGEHVRGCWVIDQILGKT